MNPILECRTNLLTVEISWISAAGRTKHGVVRELDM
jgi:hypothetical protein